MSESLTDSFRWCHRLARQTAGNFYYSFLTLPRPLRIDMCVLYAFMRVSDDLGDDPTKSPDEKQQALTAWRADTVAAIDPNRKPSELPSHPLFPALADLIARRNLPPRLLHELLDGIEMDQETVEVETFEQLKTYCYHVAGVVGLCCIHVWGFDGDDAPAAAIDCGLAFQLTNILRDVREDAEMGRVYLPREDLDRFEVERKDLTATEPTPNFRSLIRFEAERARERYRRAERLFADLHPPGRPILSAMMQIYGGLLREIERRDYDVLKERVSLPRWKKLLIATRAMIRPRLRSPFGAKSNR